MPPRRRLLFAFLYLTEGAPIGLIWWYLPTELRQRGVDVETIAALTASLALPWALKFLWAPLVDALRGPRFTFAAWVMLAQCGMIATLLPLALREPLEDLGLLTGLLLAHAFCAATQDVAIDGWAVGESEASERGSLNGWMQAGMLLGRLAFSGGALALGTAISLRGTVSALIAVLVLGLVVVSLARPPRSIADDDAHLPVGARLREVVTALLRASRLPAVRYAALLALVGGAGFEVVGALAGPFLTDLERDRGEVGLFWTLAACASIPGGLLAGRLADRLGHARTARWMLLLLTVSAGAVAFNATRGTSLGISAEATLLLVFFALGTFNAVTYALFMDLSAATARATTFSAFVGLTNLCEAWAARLGGGLVESSGYATAFAVPAAIGCVAFVPLTALVRAWRASSS